MEIKQHLSRAARYATTAAAVLLFCATVWDAIRIARLDTAPAVSYALLATAAAAAAAGVLLRVLARRPARARSTVELAAIAFALGVWWLRADPGIPADPPLVGVQFVVALVLGATARLDYRRARAELRPDPRPDPRRRAAR
jgi:hypothetical protein